MALKVGRFVAPKISRSRAVSFATALALVVTSIVAFTPEPSADAAPPLSSTNMLLNLDGNNTSSLPSSGSTWTGIAPGSASTVGTFAGNTSRYSSGGIGGVTFDGDGDGVNFGTGAGRTPGAMSLETWIKPGDLRPNWNIIASRWFYTNPTGDATSADWHFAIYNTNGVAKLNLYTSSTNDMNSTTYTFPVTSTNKWYLVGFTLDGSGNLQLFVNGESVATYTGVTHNDSSTAQLWLGDIRSNIGFVGQMSKFRLYNTGLTSTQMKSNFQADSTLYGYPVVTFKAENGSSADTYQSMNASTSTALTTNSFNKTGYTFTGWNTAANGSGTNYSNSQAVSLTSELILYAQWSLNAPTVTTSPTISGTAQVGQTLTASNGTYASGTTPTLAWQWQNSADGTTWNDISGATSSTYTLANSDGAMFMRAKQTATNATASVSATSTASALVISSGNVAGTQGASGNVGSMFTVPAGSAIYNVTLVSSNLSGAFSLGTTTGLTWVEGYSTTSSYMPTSISGSGSIFSFRGTGDAINTALASLKYTSSTVQTDALRIYSAVGSSTAQDIRNYIPIYDNGKLTFHYYSVTVPYPTQVSRDQVASTLSGTYTMTSAGDASGASVTSTNPWYLATARYSVEDIRASALTVQCSSGCWAFGGAQANAGSTQWYWPATDGFSTVANVSYTNWATSNPDQITTTARVQFFIASSSVVKWDDKDASVTSGAYIAETYSTTPLSSTTSAQTYRAVSAANAPTSLSVTPNTKFSVGLTWTAPTSLGTDPLTDYSIQYSTDQSNWITWSHTASTSPAATVTGLTPGQAYWFRVAAKTSVVGTYSGAVSSFQTDTGLSNSLTGYSVPSNMTGTIRVLLYSSNPDGKLSFTTTTNIDNGIRNTANYPDTNAFTPLGGLNLATIGSAGRMVGLVDTSVSELNAALASLKYTSPTASTDIIKMWVSNGSEYIPIISGSNVEFHYYGYNSTTANWVDSKSTSYAGAARTIDGVSLAAGTAFLATPRYRAENLYLKSLGSYTGWVNASDSTAAPVNGTEGVWKWYGPDANGVQFWNGGTAGTSVNDEYQDWGANGISSRYEPGSGTSQNCMSIWSGVGTYTYNTSPTSGYAWDDGTCSTGMAYYWEAYNTVAPYGSNTTNPAAANYSPAVATQSVAVVSPVAAPTSLTAASTVAGQIDLSWTAPVGVVGITSYSVQHSTDGTTWTETRSTASTTTTQSITGLSSGTYYQLRVAAIVSSGTGAYATTYFTPNGQPRITAVSAATKNITTLAVDSSLASRYVRVVLRTTDAAATLKLNSFTNVGGQRGTANNSSLGTAGQMIGLTGTGANVNTALQSLQYTGSSTLATDTISMWVSAGTSAGTPQDFVPVVNSKGEVEFHYFGYATSSQTWQGAVNAAGNNVDTINGQAAPGKFLATLNTLDQNNLAMSVKGSNQAWFGAADYNVVGSNNADGAWYWMGPDTGYSKFYNGSYTSGTGGIVNSSFVNWGSSSASSQSEPNGTVQQNCLASITSSYGLTNSGFVTVANVGGYSWDDNTCTSALAGYVWEYYSNEPVGSTTVGDNYSTMTAQAVVVVAPAEAPTSVAATATGTTSAVVTWAAPTVNHSTALSGYKVEWSTSSTFATVTVTATTTDANTFYVVTGLTANTPYYFRVTAVSGSTWTGLNSTVSSTTTKASATTLTVVASGGATAVTDYSTSSGMIAALASNSVSINAADLETVLAGNANVKLLADNVIISSAVTWSTNARLQLGNTTTSTVNINADVSASGASAGLIIAPAACALGSATGCYTLDVKNRINISLTGSSPSLSIGGVGYTVVNTLAGFATFAASSANSSAKWALGSSLNLSANSYTSSPVSIGNAYFTGTLDGLGNTVNNFTMTVGQYERGFFSVLDGATVRNFGLVNVNLTSTPSTSGSYVTLGALAGYSTGTTTIDQVWSTGSIKATTSSNSVNMSFGGLIGWQPMGTLTINRSWSSVNIDVSGATTGNQMIGGILGGTPSYFGQPSGSAGGNTVINQVYSTGAIKAPAAGWRGIGGIIGLDYDTGVSSLTDVFSWGSIPVDTNSGGLVGVWNGSTLSITRGYTSASTCVTNGAYTGCTPAQKPGATVSAMTGTSWGSTSGTTLVDLAAPVVELYVLPVAPTDGSYGTVGYKVVDGVGNDFTATMGSTGYPSISGTPTWDTITSASAVGTYSVKYVSGYTLSGTAASSYSLSPWTTSTSIQITKVPQSVAWAPTTSIDFGSGSATPSSLASANTAITYSLNSAGTTGCSVNSTTGVITYSSAGSCAITASAANSGNYLSASTTVTFTIGTPASAATGITVTGAGQTVAYVGWVAPNVNASTPITGYTVRYSTNAAMTGAQSVTTGSPRNWAGLTGLTANTTYYVTVTATGAAWTGTTSAVVSGTTKNAATTLNIVASGGGTSGTEFISTGGAFVSSGTSASVNAADVQNALAAGDVALGADTVNINAALSWSASTKFAIGSLSSSTVAVNATLNGSGATAGVYITPATYSLQTKSGASIVLSGATPTMYVGGTQYTVVNTVAGLSTIAATGNYAITAPLTLSTTYTAAVRPVTFAGVLDGFGNTVSNMTITPTTAGDFGFFTALGGSTIRNFGLTNVNITSATANVDVRLGSLAGNGSFSGTNTITQVWATGFIKQTAQSGGTEAGGIFGGATAGTLNISKTWSSVAVSTSSSSVGSGGIIGTNVATFRGGSGTGNTLTISESYSTGNILRYGPANLAWYGNAGIIGVSYGASQTLTNVFSWGNINSTGTNAGTSTAGISGVGPATITNAYTTHSACGGTATNCVPGVVAGATVSGFSTGLWSTVNGASLVNLTPPTKSLYVQVVAPTDGSYGTMTTQIVDSTGTVQNTATLTGLGLSISGTPTYTIDANVLKGLYNVNYVSGLTLSGTSSGVYSLGAWIDSTPVTISKYPQTITWSPTTSFQRTDTGVIVAAATASGLTTVSYAVTSAGTTGCAINSTTRALTFTGEGSCTVTATAANTGDYLAASTTATFVITTSAPIAPTATIASGAASGQVTLSWTAPSTSTTGGTIASYNVETSADGSIWTSFATGVTGTSSTVTGLTNGTSIYLRVQAVNSAGTVGAWSSALSATAYWKPLNTLAPTISGSAVGGETMSSTLGTWDANGNTVTATTYQWQSSANGSSGWSDIAGATSSTYVVSGLIGSYLSLKVSQTNAAGTTTVTTGNSVQVQSGVASAPQSVTATRGNAQALVSWAAPATTNGGTITNYKVEYKLSGAASWTAASSTVSASATTYTITGLTNGSTYLVQVTALTAAGSGTVGAAASSVIPSTTATNTVLPTVAGTVAVGRALTGTAGTWTSGGVTHTLSYQWQISATGTGSWSDIAGATTLNFTPTSAEVGSYLRLVETATNVAGVTTANSLSTTVVLTGLAAAPSAVTPTASNGQLSVTWTTPVLLNGGVISNYEVAYRASGASGWTAVTRSASTTATQLITGLTNGTAYDIQIGAITAAGTGAYAVYTATLASTPFTLPSNSVAPSITGTAAVSRTLTAVDGTWSDNGRTASYTYQWQYSTDGSTAWTNIASATASTYAVPVTHLSKYLRVNVVATNTAGSVIVSTVKTAQVLSGLASVPQTVAAVRGNTVANVTWSAPATLNGGVLSGYRVEYKKSVDSTWSTASVSDTTLSYQITNLTNGTAYDVRVVAVTGAGDSPTGAITGTVTPSTTASNTVAPAVTGTSAVGAVLTTTAGTWSTGGETPTYTYQWQVSANGLGSWSDISGATGTTYTITADEEGLFIRANVTATNGSGAVTASSESTTVVLNGLAGAPTSLAVTAGNAQLALSWTTPSLLNGGVISDYVIEYRVSGATNWSTFAHTASTATTATLTGLSNASAYDWRVSAVTAAGAGALATYSAALASTPYTTATYSAGITLSGTAAVSRSLTTTNGTWVDNGRSISYTYQWQVSTDGSTGWADISGETAASFTLASSQAGKYVRSTVIATNAAGAVSANSSASTQIQTGLASAPQSVSAIRGNTVANISWIAPAALNDGVLSGYKVEYKLSTDSSWSTATTVSDATTNYQITGLTNGSSYNVRVTAVTGAGLGAPGSLSGTVIPSTTASITIAPALTGTVAVGRTLTTGNGTWNTGGETPTYTYQWQVSSTGLGGWSDISSATASTYTLTASDLGKFIRLVVTATNGSGAVAAESASTVAVISGLAGAASALTAGADNQQLTLTWTAPTALNGGVISDYVVEYRLSGATPWTTFTHTASVATSVTISGLTNAVAYDWRVTPVTAAGTGVTASYTADLASTPYTVPTNTALPTVSGVVAVSGTVTALPGTWNSNGRTETYTYQWEVSADGSTGWSTIAGASSSTYTLTSAESGKSLRVATNATNAAGSTIAYSVATAAADNGLPSAPLAITATRANASLNVSWSAPTDLHGGVIANYIVQYSTNNSTWTTASSTVAAGATTHTVTGLTNGSAYYIRVAAITGAGQGALGTLSGTAVPSTTASNTVAPILSGTAAASRTLSVGTGSWNTGGAALTYSYQWQVSATGIGGWSDINGATTSSYVVTSAEVGQYLRAVVTATNVAGSTSEGSTITSAVLSGLANAPTGLGVTFTPMQLDVNWTGAASINGAAAITAYQVEYSADGTAWSVAAANLAANVTSCTITTGLTAGTNYFVRVAAITAAGIGAYVTSAQTTLFGGSPVVTSVPVMSGRTAVGEAVSVTAGSWNDRGVPITATTYQWQSSADNTAWTDISGATASSFTATTAESGQYVRVRVSATNSVGTTSSTVDAASVIGTGLASVPRSVSATAGDHSIAVSWSAPSTANGGLVSAYTAQYSTDGTNWTTASSAISSSATDYSITGLDNGTSYFVKIFAVTAAGAGVAFVSESVIPAGVPLLAFAPSVTGTTAVGVPLTAVVGSWGTNGQPITGYSYQWQVSPNGLGSWTDIAGATTSTFTPQASDHLDKFVRVRVSAVNSVGASLGAFSASSTQVDAGLASIVRNVSLTRGNRTIDVAWAAPLTTAGGTITGYNLEIATVQSGGAGTYSAVATAAGNATSYQLTGLTNGTEYLVRVTAVTAAGEGTFGVAASSVVPAAAPTNTVLPGVTGTLRSGYTLSASAGTWSNNGEALTSTTYQWQHSVDGTNWSDVAGATATQFVPIGFLGELLRVKVDVTNAVGTSSVFSAATAAVGIGTPGVPTGLALTPGDATVQASWSAPLNTAEGVISDYTVELSDDAGASWITITRTATAVGQQFITGLTIGDSYLVRVRTETGQSSDWITSSTYVAIGKPTHTVLPAITGTTLVGQMLTATAGTWNTNGSALTSTQYRWQESTDQGANWSDVAGATASTLTAVAGRIYRVQVTAFNAGGNTEVSSPATAYVVSAIPSAPGSLTVVPGDTQLSATWQVPTTLGGGTVSDYIVEYSSDGNTWTTVTRSASATTSQVITGLTNGENYYVRVRAVTTVLGNWANATPTAPPYGAPIFLGGTVLPHGSTVSYGSTLNANSGAWDENGSSIASYSYQWLHSSDGTNWSSISGATGSYYTVGPYVGERLSVRVSAHSSMGLTTDYLAAATPVVTAVGATAVRDLALSVADQQLTATWAEPSSLGGAALSSYRVQYSPDQIDWTTVTRANATATSETITGLTNGTAYYVRVVAITTLTGALAFAGSSVTPFGLPLVSAVPAISGTTRFGSTLTADAGTWSQNGDALTAPSYQWQYLDGSTWREITGATSNSYSIAGYVGTSLRAAVTRSNAAGSVVSFSATTSTVAPDASSTPLDLSATVGDMSLRVTWTAPSYTGGAPVTDYLVEYSNNGTDWTPVSRVASGVTNQLITGLTNGDSYFVRVRALNGTNGVAAALGTAVIPRGLPINTVAPAISGSLVYGRELSVSIGTWNANGSPVTAVSYQWLYLDDSQWMTIPGATSANYTIGALVGKSLRVAVTAANAVGQTVQATAASNAISLGAISAPQSLAVAAADQQLGLSWVAPLNSGGLPVTDYEIQLSTDADNWSTSTRAVSDSPQHIATGLTNGESYYVRVRAKVGSSTGSWVFASTTVTPRGNPIVTAEASVFGNARFGSALFSDAGSWDENGDSISATTYQWQASRDGVSWTNIPGATSGIYQVGLYVGSRIRVQVTKTNDAGSTVSSSAPTSIVTAIAAATPVVTSQSIGSAQVAVGWTPPVHTGGEALAGYTVQYSSDQNTWSSVSFGPSETQAVLSGLTNGTGYVLRVRAETTQHGSWSPVAGPFTPVAPPVVAAPTATPAPLLSPTPTPSIDPIAALLNSQVMPFALVRDASGLAPALRSETGPAPVTVTADGRIELQPTQSIALLNGQQTPATLQTTGSSLVVSAAEVNFEIAFSVAAGVVEQGSQLSISGEGFAPNTPLVTWLQSDPIKIGQSIASGSGDQELMGSIPADVVAGEHTLQINGVNADGQIVSVIYGVTVAAAPQTGLPFSGGIAFALWMALAVFLIVAVLLILRRERASRERYVPGPFLKK